MNIQYSNKRDKSRYDRATSSLLSTTTHLRACQPIAKQHNILRDYGVICRDISGLNPAGILRNYNFLSNKLTIWAGSIHKTIKKIPAMINNISAIQAAWFPALLNCLLSVSVTVKTVLFANDVGHMMCKCYAVMPSIHCCCCAKLAVEMSACFAFLKKSPAATCAALGNSTLSTVLKVPDK